MNLFKRGLIFATFLGCCLSLGFLAASLVTQHWTLANIKRVANPNESQGYVHFGLFEGKRHLNVGYGWRTYDMSVIDTLRLEPDLFDFGMWAATVACVIVAAVFSVIAALMSIVNTATTPIESVAGIPGLYAYNSIAMMFGLTGVATWVAHYYFNLKSNVLLHEDRDNQWSSEGMASFGYSFWFVVGSVLSHLANIFVLFFGIRDERKPVAKSIFPEKHNSAVLLY